MSEYTVTVAIPLHESECWADVIRGNIRRLHGRAHLVISDATELDGTFATLKAEFEGLPGITWIGRRPLAAGFVPHYNDLLARNSSPYFMWLPADDEIDARYVDSCAQALDKEDELIMAVGRVHAVPGPGLCVPTIPRLTAEGRESSPQRRVVRLVTRGQTWILFRSVFRVSALHPIRDCEGNPAADAFWVIGVLTRGLAAEVPQADYRKRFYRGSTHTRGAPLSAVQRSRFAFRELDDSRGALFALAVLVRVGLARFHGLFRDDRQRINRSPRDCGHTLCQSDSALAQFIRPESSSRSR